MNEINTHQYNISNDHPFYKERKETEGHMVCTLVWGAAVGVSFSESFLIILQRSRDS